MNAAEVGVALLALSLWVALPDPRRQLARLGPPPRSGWLRRVTHGRPGGPALRPRLALGGISCCLLLLLVPGVAGVVAGAVGFVTVVVGGAMVGPRRPAASLVQAELADTVELLAVCLAAGTSMQRALEVVGDVSGSTTAPVLSRVSGQLRMGIPEQQSWLELADDDAWGPVARDMARSARSGTSLVEVLRVHAEEARLAVREQALQQARTAGVRSVVPLMVCFLPAFVLVGVVPIIAGLLQGFSSP